MDAMKLEDVRQRLATELANLIGSINRNRIATQEISVENTEDEGDLATISHDKELLYNLHEGGSARLRLVQEAIEALDRGHYGECVRCEKEINENRLLAIPWATMCIHCQEETEMEHTSSRMTLPNPDEGSIEL